MPRPTAEPFDSCACSNFHARNTRDIIKYSVFPYRDVTSGYATSASFHIFSDILARDCGTCPKISGTTIIVYRRQNPFKSTFSHYHPLRRVYFFTTHFSSLRLVRRRVITSELHSLLPLEQTVTSPLDKVKVHSRRGHEDLMGE